MCAFRRQMQNLSKPVLDMGADALVFPMVSTAEEAGIAAACMCYPPEGTRGYGPLAANKYGEDADYALHARERLLCCVQLETGKSRGTCRRNMRGFGDRCRDNREHGFSRMSSAAQADSWMALLCRLCGRYSCQARRAGIKLGCFAPYTPEALELYGSVGVDFFLCSGDLALMTKAAREMLAELRCLS